MNKMAEKIKITFHKKPTKNNLDGKFNTERGRINCSLRGLWVLEMAWNSIIIADL